MDQVFHTVKELKEILNSLPDDMKVISKSDNFELKGNKVDGARIISHKVKKENKSFMDAFDYTYYNKEIYVNDEIGEEVIEISNMY